MKKIIRNILIVILYVILCNNLIFADSVDDEFKKTYGDYYDTYFKKNGWDNYEEYEKEYNEVYNRTNEENNKEDDKNDDNEKYNFDLDDSLADEDDQVSTKRNEKKKSDDQQDSLKSTLNKSSTFKVDPNVFYGKKKEECLEEEYLYRSTYYMKPINPTKIGDVNSASQYYYDDTKIAYYYPINASNEKKEFVVLVQDGFSELGQAVFIIDQCSFVKDAGGNWQLVKAESSQKNEEAFAKAYSDENMLIIMLNAKLKGYKSDESIKSVMFACVSNNLNDTNMYTELYKSEAKEREKEKYYMQHPQENPVNDGLNVHIFLTDYGKTVKSYLDMVYDSLESWNNGTGNGYAVAYNFDIAKSIYEQMVDMGVQYKLLYGPNSLEFLRIKQDIGYLHNQFLYISRICGFRYP